MLEKSKWMGRFAERLMTLQPRVPHALLPQVAETFWYYNRHLCPEEAAIARAAGKLPMQDVRRAWIDACGEAIRGLDPSLANQETSSLAESLWEADWVRAVDPYVMASALWEQAVILSVDLNGNAETPIDPHAVFRTRGGAKG